MGRKSRAEGAGNEPAEGKQSKEPNGKAVAVATPLPEKSGSPLAQPAVWIICGLLLAAVCLVFGQTLGHEFVNYDDEEYVYQNPHVVGGLTDDGLLWAITQRHSGNWHPLTWISHMTDCQIYGLWAGGHHLTNLLLHAATTILLFLLLVRLTAQIWSSALAAALFALHPLHVESVAWVAERKDVLSGLIFVLVLFAYVWYAAGPFSWRRYAAVVGLFALGLTAKPMLVTLPFVLLLLDFWPLGRLGAGSREQGAGKAGTSSFVIRHSSLARHSSFPVSLVLEKLPLLALSAVSCVLTIWAQGESVISQETLPFRLRLSNALVSYAAYLGQFFFPCGLNVFYPHRREQIATIEPLAAFLLLAAISAWAVIQRRKRPYLLTGWLWYLGMLVPVIGLVQVSTQAMADRYMYLPQIGLCLALVWSVASYVTAWKWQRRAFVAAALALTVLATAAFRQVQYWQDSESLWTRALVYSPNCDRITYSLAHAYHVEGKLGPAIQWYRKTVQLNPTYSEAYSNLGTALNSEQKFDEAIGYLEKAIEIDPLTIEAYVSLAAACRELNRADEALDCYAKVLQIEPNHVTALSNRAVLLDGRGRTDEAIAELNAALAARPAVGEFHAVLGKLLLRKYGMTGKKELLDEAVKHLNSALAVLPDQAETHYHRGIVLQIQGNSELAIASFERALKLRPDMFDAQCALGNALLGRGRVSEAIVHFRRGLALQPDNADANMAMALAMAQAGHSSEAIGFYQKAAKVRPQNADAVLEIATALLRQQAWNEARVALEKALEAEPKNIAARALLVDALLQGKRSDDAIDNLRILIEAAPKNVEVRKQLGKLLVAKRKLAEAREQFQAAAALSPEDVALWNSVASCSLQLGRIDEAIAAWQKAVKLKPDQRGIHYELGSLLVEKGRTAEGLAQWREELRLMGAKPDPNIINNLAWLLATNSDASLRNGSEAVKLAQQADLLTGSKQPAMLGTLAAAYAEAGQFAAAVETAERAKTLAVEQGDKALVESLDGKIKLYQAGKPWHEQKQVEEKK